MVLSVCDAVNRVCDRGADHGFYHAVRVPPYGYWIVFFLFLFVGGKMIYDAVFGDEECGIDLTGWKILLVLAVATSIDALAVGVSYALLGEEILLPAIIIGVVAFVFFCGRRFCRQ